MNNKMKRIAAYLATVIMVLCAVPMANLAGTELGITASAAKTVKSGKCGDNVIFSLDDKGVLTISGKGEMWDYYLGETPYSDYHDDDSRGILILEDKSIKNVIVLDGVTHIGNLAFDGCTALTEVTLPDSITSIGFGAFEWCENLKSIKLPKRLENIKWSSFRKCVSLKTIEIPSGVTYIDDNAFEKCEKLTSVKIPNSVTEIGYCAFNGCSSLTNIKIPNSVTSIGNYAFYYCDSLTSITVDTKNKNYSSLDGVLFNKNKTTLIQYPIGNKRTKYTIPNSVTSIGNDAFSFCDSLTSITIGNSVTSIGNYAFYYCDSLTSITIPNSVTSIGNSAFYYCSSLTSITIPNSVTSISPYAFSGCSNLTNIKIPNSVTSISPYAFSGCSNLTSIKIPDSVTYIGYHAFSGSAIYKNKSNWKDGVLYINNCLIEADNSLIPSDYSIRKETRVIAEYAFYDCSNLKNIEIPDGVTTISTEMFSGCKNLKSVIIPSSVTSIKDYAFYSCKNLKIYYCGSKTQWNKIEISYGDYDKKITEIADITYNYKPVHKHTWSSWQTTKKATYTSTGTQTRTCSACGSKETKTIAKLAITKITDCTFTVKSVAYTGKAVKPSLTVKNGKTTLKAETHYTVAYKNNTKIGKATVTIKGVEKNGYTGTKSLTFKIVPANVKNLKATQTTSSIKLTWSKVSGATGYRVFKYDTKNKKWVKVADTKNTNYKISKLSAGTSYKYAVKAYTTVSKTTYWSGTYAQLTTATKPATPTLKATAGTKKAALSWNKIAGATGYEVYMSTKKDSGYKKVTTIKKNATVKYTKKDLKKGTTYYFKIRAYKTVDGKKVYSSYSAVKSVKVK